MVAFSACCFSSYQYMRSTYIHICLLCMRLLINSQHLLLVVLTFGALYRCFWCACSIISSLRYCAFTFFFFCFISDISLFYFIYIFLPSAQLCLNIQLNRPLFLLVCSAGILLIYCFSISLLRSRYRYRSRSRSFSLHFCVPAFLWVFLLDIFILVFRYSNFLLHVSLWRLLNKNFTSIKKKKLNTSHFCLPARCSSLYIRSRSAFLPVVCWPTHRRILFRAFYS